MFNVGDKGEYRFENGRSSFTRQIGTIVKITPKFLFVRFGDLTENEGDVVVFNADGTGTSRGAEYHTFPNGEPFPAGVDDGTDAGSTFVVTKTAKKEHFLEADKQLAKALREAVRQANTWIEELTRRDYNVEIDMFDGEVSIEKTVVL